MHLKKLLLQNNSIYIKKEVDEDAYFAEGYNLTLNEEQEKQRKDFFGGGRR